MIQNARGIIGPIGEVLLRFILLFEAVVFLDIEQPELLCRSDGQLVLDAHEAIFTCRPRG